MHQTSEYFDEVLERHGGYANIHPSLPFCLKQLYTPALVTKTARVRGWPHRRHQVMEVRRFVELTIIECVH